MDFATFILSSRMPFILFSYFCRNVLAFSSYSIYTGPFFLSVSIVIWAIVEFISFYLCSIVSSSLEFSRYKFLSEDYNFYIF